ncbi:hypothetical protein I551_3145 [Mycobacterium ulcerans str. Harvey]|uniref:Uncharacterized protein n=1 Tax=Mycobacterium ulcerans str. Harvey TaxID=1299332 RepID=A0ABN0R059_MYCUL|nr:hypothetical protein I551_3145 [Mycobacterium ulcerans str. Harvey]
MAGAALAAPAAAKAARPMAEANSDIPARARIRAAIIDAFLFGHRVRVRRMSPSKQG